MLAAREKSDAGECVADKISRHQKTEGVLDPYVEEVEGSATQSGRMVFHFAQMMAAALQVTGCEISRLTALVSGKAGTGFNFTLRFKNGEVAPEGICFQ